MGTTKHNGLFIIFNEKGNNQQDDGKPEEPANFETAIAATGFGKFNVMLLLLAIPSSFASMFDTSSMSYVFPIAQCDLSLSLDDKGLLNAITYIGMISSGFVWGYIADAMGRRKLLIVGYLLDAFFVLLSGFSQHFPMIVAAKFMTGFMINGPFSALMSYMNEFHTAKYRSYIPLANGVIHSVASILLPFVGWLIFTDTINLSLFNDAIALRSWNIFLFVCSLPSLISGICYMFLPESPKFLMTVGRNEQALRVFQRVYSCNSGKPRNEYPIKAVHDEVKPEGDSNSHEVHITANRSKARALKEGCMQLVPLFYPPFLAKILLVFSIQFVLMMGLNTIRLWLPQLFAAINDYHTFHKEESADLCTMLEMVNPSEVINNGTCFVNYDNSAIYVNNMYVALIIMAVYLSTAMVIRRMGKKWVLVGSSFFSGLCAMGLYWAQSDVVVVVLSSLHVGLGGLACNVVLSIVVDIFPTSLRTMTLSLTMVFGRLGAVLGNIFFPFLLTAGCLPSFLVIGSLAIASSLLSLLLPTTDQKALE